MRRWRSSLLRALIVLYTLGVGFLTGVVSERMRFDVKRAALLTELGAAIAEVHGRQMALEGATAMGAGAQPESAAPAEDRTDVRGFP
jgi:hypothetical protein